MLGKRTRPATIGKFPDPLMSSGRLGYPETITSPKCSLEFRILSPRTLKNSDPVAGVGLGIVAALEKSSSDVLVKTMVDGSNLRSNPIPINGSTKIYSKCEQSHPQEVESRVECMESYTYVTSHKHNKPTTKTYCDKGVETGAGHDRNCREDMRSRKVAVFCESPPRTLEVKTAFPTLDFLSSCYLCRKKLHGIDIYMYRGEKAFCSAECRCRQIAIDERKEKCGSELSRTADVSSSPYTRDNLFFTGVIVA
ncbi:hypothetical protein IFM89_028516 [Coptis chinensis]|uniref:FLZ-type domain-containing protein n=1 Tax=Coptis chinensis TaxID=261450 RepID=A0A835IDM3_9MAGN|nr:hypothetical protein IFM89_028516 [Coptis chinensis]